MYKWIKNQMLFDLPKLKTGAKIRRKVYPKSNIRKTTIIKHTTIKFINRIA